MTDLTTQLNTALEELRAAYPGAEFVSVDYRISRCLDYRHEVFTASNRVGDYGQGSTIEAALANLKTKTDPGVRARALREEAARLEAGQ